MLKLPEKSSEERVEEKKAIPENKKTNTELKTCPRPVQQLLRNWIPQLGCVEV